jgi:hypothetical protein
MSEQQLAAAGAGGFRPFDFENHGALIRYSSPIWTHAAAADFYRRLERSAVSGHRAEAFDMPA